jgi:hypothetical protein
VLPAAHDASGLDGDAAHNRRTCQPRPAPGGAVVRGRGIVVSLCAVHAGADVALAATLHDPPGALADDIRRALPRLRVLYRAVEVATSPPTASRVKALLEMAGAYAGTPAANRRGPLYRLSVRRALASGAARVHYLDLDRALRWVRLAPRELRAALRRARRHRVLLLGRTPRAHRSHHLPLYATEVLANRLIGLRLGIAGRLDVLVPSFVLEARAGAALLARSRARDLAVYGEWAALVLGMADEVAYLECRGLDWETPDRHRRAVRRVGLAAWRRRQETPAEWSLRIDMAREILAGFERAHARWPAAPPALRRLP